MVAGGKPGRDARKKSDKEEKAPRAKVEVGMRGDFVQIVGAISRRKKWGF